jgi:hypothetical protein
MFHRSSMPAMIANSTALLRYRGKPNANLERPDDDSIHMDTYLQNNRLGGAASPTVGVRIVRRVGSRSFWELAVLRQQFPGATFSRRSFDE